MMILYVNNMRIDQYYTTEQSRLKEEMQSMKCQIDLLTNQIDLSEIAPSQHAMLNPDVVGSHELLQAVELLAKDIGYGYSKKGIEAALDCSDMSYNTDEAIQVVAKASAKIRELRELIENLSKKLCISENGDDERVNKMNRHIEKLKKQNRVLLKDNNELETIVNHTLESPKPAYNNYIIKSQKALKGMVYHFYNI